ncbi:MAG: hypothetical protein ABI886_17185, partial [Betaproteobacteria bacterium]
MNSPAPSLRATAARVVRVWRHLTAASPDRRPPSLAKFVALSLLLHLLALVLLRDAGWFGVGHPDGSGTTLAVTLQPRAVDIVASTPLATPATTETRPAPRAPATAAMPAAPARPRIESRPAQQASPNAGDLPTAATPRPARPVDAPARYVAPPVEGLLAPAIPLGHLEAVPKIDREFTPLAKLAPTRELPPAGSAPLPRMDAPPRVDREIVPTARLAPPQALPPPDAPPLRRLDAAPANRAIAPLPKVERPSALAADAAPLEPVAPPPVVDRSLAPLPKADVPREL